MKAAKIARRFPLVLALLAEGRLNLTTVRLVAPLEILARRFPRPEVASSVRKLPRIPPPPKTGVASPNAGVAAPREVPAVSTSDLNAYDASLPDPIKSRISSSGSSR